MKYTLLAVLAAVFFSVPLTALAAPTDTTDTSNPTAFQAFAQARARIDQLHNQARISVLNALTPAHRNLLAQVVGQLAISPTVDVASAARLLDSNLSPGEAQTIVNAAASLRQQVSQVMLSARQQFEGSLPSGAQPQGLPRRSFSAAQSAAQSDPGTILLRLTIPSIGHEFGRRSG